MSKHNLTPKLSQPDTAQSQQVLPSHEARAQIDAQWLVPQYPYNC
jgi:hypothetical protein